MRNLASFFIFVALVSVAKADTTDELLRLVPKETTVCFVVQDLRGNFERILNSPFAEWLKTSAWGKRIAATPDWQKLEQFQKTLTEQLDFKPSQIRNDILGDTIVYAYQSDKDAGVFLTQARAPELLAKLIRNLNDVQTKAGEVLKIVEKTHAGEKYFAREKPEGRFDYYWVNGGSIAYSSNEIALQRVLDRREKAPTVAKEMPFFGEARRKLGFEKAAFAGLFAPRSIDAELDAAFAVIPNEDGRAFLKQLTKFWLAIDTIGLGVELDRGAAISLAIATKPEKVPAELKMLTEKPTSSSVWVGVPSDAFLAVAGKAKLQQWLDLGRSFMSEANKEKLNQILDQKVAPVVGRDLLPQFLDALGPDWGAWIASPPKGEKGAPATLGFALQLPKADSKEAKVRDAVKTGLDFFVQAYRVEYNRTHEDQIRSDEVKTSTGSIQTLSNDKLLPPGVTPSYGLRGDYLVAGSHPDTVSAYPLELKAKDEHAGLLIRFASGRTAAFLKEHAKPVAEWSAKLSGKSVEEEEKAMLRLAESLEIFEKLELRHTGDGNVSKLTLRIEFAKPLKQ